MKRFITLLSIIALSLMIITPAMAGDTNGAIAGALSGSDSSALIEGDVYNNEAVDLPAPAGEINYPGAPNMLGGATPSYMDRLKVKDILEYDEDGITLNMALQMRQDDAFMGKRIMVREKYGKMVEKSRIPADHPMKVVYTKQADMQSLGTITVVSDSKKSVSPDVFAEIVIKAHELGAVALHVKAEGFQRLVRNEGAGIGFTWSGTSMGNAGTVSAQTGVMGIGKSWGEAGYFDHPFIVVHALFPKGYKIDDARKANGNIMDWLKD
jgi:hypothetical protein